MATVTSDTRRRGAPSRRAGGGSSREAILTRAMDLASAEGLEGLTIGRLARELEMSKSGLFGHFGSKQELQLATIDAAAARFVAEVVDPVAAEKPGDRRLRALCERYLDHLEAQVFEGGCFWAAAATEFDDRPGPVRDAVRDGVAAWLAGLAGEAELAGAADPDQLAYELYSLAVGANTTYRLLGDERAFARARTAIERLLADV